MAMLYLEDLKYLKLYKKKFYLPINLDDKKHGSVIMLLTPDYTTSNELMNYKLAINRVNSFKSYYIERDIMYTIQHESRNLEVVHHDYSQIINEQPTVFTETTDMQYFDSLEDAEINELYCRLGDKMIFFNEMYDEDIFNETAGTQYNSRYKMLLYNDRMRNNKEVFRLYDQVKQDNKWIEKTFVKLSRYNKLNLFVDLYYYHQVFLTNNTFAPIRSLKLYREFIRRFLMDARITNAGYTKKTIFVPIDGWSKVEGSRVYDYNKNLNPISMIYHALKLDPTELNDFGDMELVFIGRNGYFRVNMKDLAKSGVKERNLFSRLILKLESHEVINDDDDEPDSSVNGITTDIVDKLEKNSGIVVHSLTGSADSKATTTKAIEKAEKKQTDITQSKEKETVVKQNNPEKAKKAEEEIEKDKLKQDMVDHIQKAAENSKDEAETIDKLESDEQFKRILQDLQDAPDEGIKVSSARSARITKNRDDLMKKKVAGKTVEQMINSSNKPAPLPETAIPIKTINDEWKHLKAVNFEKTYDLDADIVKCLNSLSDPEKMYPVSILDIAVADTSTSEDSVYTYTVKCEDYSGKRFTLKFDIPKLRDNRFMRLRGNEKIFSIEMPLIPVSKTDPDAVQICSFYNKIFVETYNTSTGKSNPFAGRLIKTLDKYEGKDIKITRGDNTKICNKYDLPIDYIDLASQYTKIELSATQYSDGVTIYFNQDEIRSIEGVNPTKGIPIAVDNKGTVTYYTTNQSGTISEAIYDIISLKVKDFHALWSKQNDPRKCTYSRAHILNTDIPVIVILAHDLGLTKAMDLAGIDYEISEKRTNEHGGWDRIKLSDCYIYYNPTYTSMMLMNGLKDCDTESMSIKDINSKMTWVNQLENFGGRIKSDGLDNCRDLMYDPVTKEVSRTYGLPDNYHEALVYASNLLVDNKYAKHTDLSTNRYRTNEVIAAQFYRVLSSSYREYAMQQKHGRKVGMTMNQYAVIDLILAQNNTSDLSVFQPLWEIEAKNTISTKGVTGMNAERAYKIDKRGYDDSMVNIIAQATGFATTVGINRQTTINPNIDGGRGYFNQSGEDNMNVVNTYCMTEALNPFAVTSDDPFRNDMSFVQNAKHSTPIEYGSPLLVTTGADAAMPYLCSDMFAHKAKQAGTVKEITDKYMIVEYKDGSTEFVNLDEQTMKNSDGGFYITLQLKTDLKVGNRVKEGEVLAYDKKSFSKDRVGSGQLAFNNGCLAKVAILTTEDGYEDSGFCSEWLCEAMASDIVVMKSVTLPPMTNILEMKSKGSAIREGEPILIFQNAYDDEDANILLKNLNADDGDITEIGRNVIKSKVTGVLSDIKIYRTCELNEMSDSLKKIVNSYEKDIKAIKRLSDTASNDVQMPPTEKLDRIGKTKNVDGVMIEFYMRYHDIASVGDKQTVGRANKNVLMGVYKTDESPYTDFRPNEKIDAVSSAASLDSRMITSVIKEGSVDKAMIELSRKVCDIMGVKWKDLHEMYNEDMKK